MPRLFESEHGKRFAILQAGAARHFAGALRHLGQEFNLTKMLNSSKTKTHREVESMPTGSRCVSAAYVDDEL